MFTFFLYRFPLLLLACPAAYCMTHQRYSLSNHSLIRMQERGAARADIVNTLLWGKKEEVDGKVFCTLGKEKGKTKKHIKLLLNEDHKRVVTVMKKPEDSDEKRIKKARRRKKVNHAQHGKSIIPHLYLIQPITPLEKNIAKAIQENDETLFTRLLDLDFPHRTKDPLLARCFMHSVKLNKVTFATMLLARATSYKQLCKITKDDYFRSLPSQSTYPELLRTYSSKLLAQKMVRELQQKNNL